MSECASEYVLSLPTGKSHALRSDVVWCTWVSLSLANDISTRTLTHASYRDLARGTAPSAFKKKGAKEAIAGVLDGGDWCARWR